MTDRKQEIADALAAMHEGRSEKLGPMSPSAEGAGRLWGAQPSLSGIAVNEQTMMTYAAYFSAVRIVSEDVAKLSFSAYEKTSPKSRQELPPEDPLQQLLLQPDPDTDQFGFIESTMSAALTWGNGYAEIERTGAGRAVATHMLEPNRVRPDRTKTGKLIYDVANSGRPNVAMEPEDILHLRGFGNGIVGLSVARLARDSMGVGMAAEQFGAKFFGHGTHLTGVLTHPGTLGEEGIKNLRKGWGEMYSGMANVAAIAVLEEGMLWNKIGIPPEDAQFLETRQFQIAEVARWFRIPPHKLADLARATFSNIEHQSIEYVTDTLLAWALRWEGELDRKLIPARERGRRFTKMNLNVLLRGDLISRYGAYKIGREIGVLSINDVRMLEDMNPIGPAGDVHTVPLNMTTAEKQMAGDDAATDEVNDVVAADAADQIANKDDKAVGRALKKFKDGAAFRDWLDEFGTEQKAFVAKRIAIVEAAAGRTGLSLRAVEVHDKVMRDAAITAWQKSEEFDVAAVRAALLEAIK